MKEYIKLLMATIFLIICFTILYIQKIVENTEKTKLISEKNICKTIRKSGGGVLGMIPSCGQFGNHVFQYIFLRVYCEKYGLKHEFPSWEGNVFFDIEPTELKLRKNITEVKHGKQIYNSFLGNNEHIFEDVNLSGHFILPATFYSENKRFIQEKLVLKKSVLEIFTSNVDDRFKNNTLIVFHFRFGDFQIFYYPKYYVKITEDYKKNVFNLIEDMWKKYSNPILYIASDEPEKILIYFQKFKPLSSKDLNINFKPNFLIDFYVMMKADILGVYKNSTFSFTAALLNSKAKFYIQDFKNKKDMKRIVEFNPWNSLPFDHGLIGHEL